MLLMQSTKNMFPSLLQDYF